MIVAKCASCGAVMETKGDETTDLEEITHSLCPICEITIQEAEEPDFVIPIEDTDT